MRLERTRGQFRKTDRRAHIYSPRPFRWMHPAAGGRVTEQDVRAEVDVLQKRYLSESPRSLGHLRRFVEWFGWKPQWTVRPEIHQDWLIVKSFADRALSNLVASREANANGAQVVAKPPAQQGLPGAPADTPEKSLDRTAPETIAEVLARLEAAVGEHNFATAWRHVNSADALLPLVVPESELESCEARLSAWDTRLPKGLRTQLEESGAKDRVRTLRDARKPATPEPDPSAPSGKVSPSTQFPPPGVDELRDAIHELQQIRAQCWNETNNQITFMGKLWIGAGTAVLIALLMAIAVAEALAWTNPEAQAMRLRFAGAAILGLFGGALSSFLTAREVAISIPRYQLVVIHTVLRMLIGAAGAFVVVLSTQALPAGELTEQIRSNPFVYLMVGIAAGFSERLFVGALERVALNLSTVSTVDHAA